MLLKRNATVFCSALDDILIASRTWQEHLKHLRITFSEPRKQKLFVKRKKCKFNKPKLKWLGLVVGRNELQAEQGAGCG